jgi:AcrR family transcriptional regulator
MPRVWTDTIEAHRREVQKAILSNSATLVAERGLRSVTMSQIAEASGIGRATLYKYFSSVEAILLAWHERQIADHLEQLEELRDHARDPGEGLEAVLEAYALIQYQHHGTELEASLHQGAYVAEAQRRLHGFVQDLLSEGARSGYVRDDVPPDELASYSLRALATASTLPSKAAVGRLVSVTLTGLRRS